MKPADCVVTVLVAAYNAENFLHECLDSLRRQTLRKFQVVCIDDASTDGSLQILMSYQRRDPRFEVVHLSRNHGQAYARNQGLKQARGRYVCFLDSDDWLGDDALEKAVAKFEAYPDTGCVLFDTIYYYDEARQRRYPMRPFTVLSGYDAFVKSLTWQIHGVYMVKAEIHKRFPYDESSRAYSDDNTTRLHYLASKEVRVCGGRYYYRQHADSVTHKVSPRRFDYLAANLSMKRKLLELKVGDGIVTLYENHRWLNVVDTYMFYHQNRHRLSPTDAASGLARIHEAWKSIEVNRLTLRNRLKFGYCPLRFSWRLFRLEEELYFGLKHLLFRKRIP